MKKTIGLLMLMFTLLGANELKTVYSYQNAVYKAKKEHKLVMVMMSLHSCPVCAYMKDIVLERPAVLQYLNNHFFVVIKDIEHDHYPSRFATIDSPTFFFIDPETQKEVIEKKVGGFRPEEFLEILKEANRDTDTNTTDINATQTVEKSANDNNRSMTPCNKIKPCEEKPKVEFR